MRLARLILLAAVFALGLLLLVTPAWADSPAPQESTLTGTLTRIWADPRPGSGSAPPDPIYMLWMPQGAYQLLFAPGADDHPDALLDRAVTVRLTGEPVTAAAVGPRALHVDAIRAAGWKVAPGAAPSALPLGNQSWVTLLCKYADQNGEPRPRSYYEQLLSGAYPGADHYWRTVSYDQANVAGSRIFGWYRLPNPQSSYVVGGCAYLEQLMRDCMNAAEDDVYFPDYVGVNIVVNGSLGSASYGGSASSEADDTWRLYRMTWLPDWGQTDQAVVMHEMGHGFGMIHSSLNPGGGYDNVWDVMSNSYISPLDPTWTHIAQEPIAFQKARAGWLPTDRVHTVSGFSDTFTLTRLAEPTATGYLMARVPFPEHTDSYYTIEMRGRIGYDQSLPGAAVIIHAWQADLGRVLLQDADANGNSADAGAMWTPGETFGDADRSITIRVNAADATTASVTVTTRNPPLIITPGIDAAQEPGDVRFEWQPLAGAAGYELQIDVSATFDSPALTTVRLAEARYTLPGATAGRRYWRVRALPNGVFSVPRALVVALPALPISEGPGDYAPQLVRGSDGRLQLYYLRHTYGSSPVIFRQVSADDGLTWSPATRALDGSDMFAFASGPNNRWWVVYASSGILWQADSRDNGATWSQPKRISYASGWFSYPSLIRDRDGRLWMVTSAEIEGKLVIYLWHSPDGGASWGDPIQLSPPGVQDQWPSIVERADGALLAMWTRIFTDVPVRKTLAYRVSADGVTWSPVAEALPSRQANILGLAAEPGGRIWQVTEVPSAYAYSDDGGRTWSPAYPLGRRVESELKGAAVAALGGSGVAAVWSSQRGDPPRWRIWYARPGEREDVNPPPAVQEIEGAAAQLVAGAPAVFRAYAEDESPGVRVDLVWSLDGVPQPALAFTSEAAIDDPTHWSATLAHAPAGVLAYRIRATDSQGNVAWNANQPSLLYVMESFVRQHDVLVVFDDENWNSNPWEQAAWVQNQIAPVLATLGVAPDVWYTRYRGLVPAAVLKQYRGGAVLWFSPLRPYKLARPLQIRALAQYLAAGGRLLISGDSVAYTLAAEPFLADYLHVASRQLTYAATLQGVAGDPVGSELQLKFGSDASSSAYNYHDALQVLPPAAVAFRYPDDGGQAAGLRVDSGTYRIVFLGFSLPDVRGSADRARLLNRSLEWLGVAPQPTVRAYLTPPAAHGGVGGAQRFDLLLDAAVQRVDAVTAILNFDPRRFQVVTETGQPALSIAVDRRVFSVVGRNRVDNAAGVIEYSASVTGPVAEGILPVASFRLRALVRGSGSLTFGPETCTWRGLQPVLKQAEGATVLIENRTYLPLLIQPGGIQAALAAARNAQQSPHWAPNDYP